MARRTRKKKKTALGCLVWFALVLVIVVVFLIARPSIIRAVQGSGLADLFRPRTAEPVQTTTPPADPADTTPAPSAADPVVTVEPAPTAAPATPEPKPAVEKTPEPAATPAPTTTATPAPATPRTTTTTRAPTTPRATPPPAATARNTRTSTLYFLRQDGEGVTLDGLAREVKYTDSPLTDTLAALLTGPTAAETARGYQSFIPAGTRLESVQIRGDTAYVSFNESFRMNPYGRDGLAAQLRQVVWTVTEFSSVKAVQILIGGKTTEYLGPEGLRIRDPVSRESLGGH